MYRVKIMTDASHGHFDIAILLPCYNEATTIAAVVRGFREALPSARVYVYDNNSTDGTALQAMLAGAIVMRERRQGKGHVVRRMFADIDADIYVMADGDGTYAPHDAEELIRTLLTERSDMVVGTRRGVHADAGRNGHAAGNRLFNLLYRTMFSPDFTDIFSGYRAFSRRFVKSFPAVSGGFEIETEMSVHASQLRMPIVEMPTAYGARQEGSTSKLNTIRDGIRILLTFMLLLKEVRPAQFYGTIALVFVFVAIALGIPLLDTYIDTGTVPRFPTAILATGLMLLAGISLMCGLILDSVARGRLEQKRIQYLLVPRFKNGQGGE